jgi:hypothetical protein
LQAIGGQKVEIDFLPFPLTLKAGDPVNLGDAHPQRAGYVWANDGSISAGWVPLDLIDRSQTQARALKDYCSAELATQHGERVRLVWEDRTHAAWWCESRDSERGWVWATTCSSTTCPPERAVARRLHNLDASQSAGSGAMIITVSNNKGGVGKTALAASGVPRRRNVKVLAVDLDSQGPQQHPVRPLRPP